MKPILVLLTICPLLAHDLYIMPEKFAVKPGETVRIDFHNGDSFPASDVAPRPNRLREAKLVSSKDSTSIQDIKEAGKVASGTVAIQSAGSLLLTIQTIPNFIELPEPKFSSYLKHEGLDWVIAWRAKNNESAKPGRERYSKYPKALLLSGAPDENYKHVLGLPVEIVPLSNPHALRPGQKLPVRVLFQGKPAKDVQVQTAWADGTKNKVDVAGRTGSNGEIEIPIPSTGKWRLHALVMEHRDEPDVDWESYWASLTFEVL